MTSYTKNVNLYPKNRSPKLDPRLFQNPTSEYRGTPFWSWNCKLDKAQLLRQIETLRQMGFGGFHMHPRTGMDTPYLQPEFFDLIKACVQDAKRKHMLAWLYDEDRWPSGFAGGLVTQHKQHRAKHLLWTCKPYADAKDPAFITSSSAAAIRGEAGKLIGHYQVTLTDGFLTSYRLLKANEKPGNTLPKNTRIWSAYLESARPSSWFNNQTYVDTLSPAAIQEFVHVTHERYFKALGKEFGKTVPAIFTDEPQFTQKSGFHNPDDTRDLINPFTSDFLQTYFAAYGQRLEQFLPEIFWQLPNHDHLAERFAAAYADTIGQWCADHNLASTGHLMEEGSLWSQNHATSESMRSYRSFQIPGIDMLCDSLEYTTAKQCQSVAHQFGRPGTLSELYGVTNWDYDFIGHKAQGDWQAALGVTVRVPHLAWVSMAGEAKRDYPAAIGYQSPWYQEYPYIEDHFARVNTLLTRGNPAVRVAVVHPIESYWIAFGPYGQTRANREQLEAKFQDLTKWLLMGAIDFDFIGESLLPTQSPLPRPSKNSTLQVGHMNYDAVVVPNMRTIRASTLDRLEAFANAGGTVIFMGEIPAYVDALESDRPAALAQRTARTGFDRLEILDALNPFRDIDVRVADGSRCEYIISQLRIDGPRRHLYLVNTNREGGFYDTTIKLRGNWRITHMDTLTGKTETLASQKQGPWTLVPWHFHPHASLLLTLEPGWRPGGKKLVTEHWREQSRIAQPEGVTLSEPNCLLLDQAEWRVNNQPWQPLEEVLRLDNLARKQFGLGERTGHIAQPWVDQKPVKTLGQLALRFTVRNLIDVQDAQLALEDAEKVTIFVDGEKIPNKAIGWYVDESIKCVPLPFLEAGQHEIEIHLAYNAKTNVEWAYLLGDFGVNVAGREAQIVPLDVPTFGDWTRQGLPFYAGNVTYECVVEGTGKELALHIARFSNPLLSVSLDGKPLGKIALAPFRLSLGKLAKGSLHKLDITAFGNRVNAFGPVHGTDEERRWFGPDSWRTTGENWAYEYQLKRMGLLSAPIIEVQD